MEDLEGGTNYGIDSQKPSDDDKPLLKTFSVSRPNSAAKYNTAKEDSRFLQMSSSFSATEKDTSPNDFVKPASFLQTQMLTKEGIQMDPKVMQFFNGQFGGVPTFWYIPQQYEVVEFDGQSLSVDMSLFPGHDGSKNLGNSFTILWGMI